MCLHRAFEKLLNNQLIFIFTNLYPYLTTTHWQWDSYFNVFIISHFFLAILFHGFQVLKLPIINHNNK